MTGIGTTTEVCTLARCHISYTLITGMADLLDRVHTTFLSQNSRPFQGLFKVLLFFSRLNRIGKTLDLLQNACRSKHTFIGWRIMQCNKTMGTVIFILA